MSARREKPADADRTSHTTRLEAAGNFAVAPEVLAWAENTATAVYRCLKTRDLVMHLRAYRHLGLSHLACDVCPVDDSGMPYPITFTTCGVRDLDQREPRVADFVEALFMAGLLAERLGARTVIDVALG